jgi:hypothetical protein
MRTLTYKYLLFLVTSALFADISIAQQEFPIGAFLDIYSQNRHNPLLYQGFGESGMNTIWAYIDGTTKNYLSNIGNVTADNEDTHQEYIHYYGTSYYSKWEAEENQTNNTLIGVKHRYGNIATWKNKLCWTSTGLTAPSDSLMFGPHYHQEVLYHRYYFYPDWVDSYILKYIPRFSMALIKDPSVNQNENVCVIKVVHRYTKFTKQPDGSYDQGVRFEDVLRKDTLKVNRFRTDSSFSDIYFDEIIPKYYEYDNRFRPNYESMRTPQMRPSEQSAEFIYSDILLDNGIQFCVDWLRSDTLCALYIDYAEVYDNNGWAQFLEDPGGISSRIKVYAQEMDFTNLKYFAPGGEPGSLDAIIPIRTVDSLIRTVTHVNKNLCAGSYEHIFNSSSLASRVNVYSRQAVEIISSKKMRLLK